MKVACPDYLSKVSPIIGDCKKPNLGISENERNTIISEVTVVFHVAATVRFDEHLKEAVHINIRATGDLLDIAKSMRRLKVSSFFEKFLKIFFVYICKKILTGEMEIDFVPKID